MIFYLDKSILRPWTLQDEQSLVKHANNRNISDYLRDGFPYPYTLRDAKQWLSSTQNSKDLLFAIEVNDEAIGGIGIIYKSDIYRKNAEIGYWLSEKYWNKGIITEAVQALIRHLFSTTKINRVYAGIFENNTASERVLVKCGFRLEGIHKKAIFKHGNFLDEYLYAILKS